MSGLPFKIAIPSRGRANVISKNPLWQAAHVVIDNEEERDAYCKAGVPDSNLVICDPYLTVSAKRQWILDNLWDDSEPFIMQVDDDFIGFWPKMRWRRQMITAPDDLIAAFWESYISAADLGTGMFGYGRQRFWSRIIYSNEPVRLRYWIACVTGIIDRTLRYDPELYMVEDVDISFASLARSRVTWLDNRFVIQNLPDKSPGGMTNTRTKDRFDLDTETVQKRWGIKNFRRVEEETG